MSRSAFRLSKSLSLRASPQTGVAIRFQNAKFSRFPQICSYKITDSHVASLLGMTEWALRSAFRMGKGRWLIFRIYE